MKKSRRPFSPEFRREALVLLRQGGTSANAWKELGINQTTLSRWKRQAQGSAEPVNELQTAEEVRRLRHENERLRTERDILKKAAAFFAKESE